MRRHPHILSATASRNCFAVLALAAGLVSVAILIQAQTHMQPHKAIAAILGVLEPG